MKITIDEIMQFSRIFSEKLLDIMYQFFTSSIVTALIAWQSRNQANQ